MSHQLAALRAILALTLCACRSAPPAPPPHTPADVGYAFELASLDPPCVRASLRTNADSSGTSVFAVAPALGEHGSVADLIHELRASDAQGAELPLEKVDERHWTIAAPAGTSIVLRWELHPLPPDDKPSDYGNEYRPIVTKDWFHTTGDNALVWPEWMENDVARDFELTWRGFREAHWSVACSHGADQELVRTRRTLPAFRRAVFVAGKLRLHERQLGDSTLCCALLGDHWKFSDDEFVDLAARIVSSERAFFEDPGPPFYLVTLLPTPALAEGSFSLGGTALTDSFALFVMDGIGLEPGSDKRLRIARLLAHEHMHTWTGTAIAPSEPEELAYWFTEGFTEFFTGRLLLAAGLITAEQRTDGLNEMLASHWTSPARNAPNERIHEAFWSDPAVQRLPYARGEIVAIRLDNEIRRASHGQRTLDDFVRELLADARAATGSRVSTETLLERVARWTSPELAEELRRTIVDGVDLALPADTWSEWVALEQRQSATYALGFDRDATFKSGVVSGVADGSPPWEAGLRNGQHAVAFSATGNDPDHEVSLTIRDDQGRRELRWLPRGEALEVPAFRLVRPGLF